MVPFAGWDMPLNYGSQIEEHNAVRERAGLFDVSHMTIIDLPGSMPRRSCRSSLPTTSAAWAHPAARFTACC